MTTHFRAGITSDEPVLDRFCETLEAVSTAREDLQEKCCDLQQRLRRFLEAPTQIDEAIENDDDGSW